MADGTARPVIFFSYSHKDRRWLDYVISHFRPAERNEIFSLLYDLKLNGGDELKDEIATQLDTCNLCVLLVSRHSLDSDPIMTDEMERIRKRNIRIFPIVVTQTTTFVVKWLDQKLLRPENGKPLQKYSSPARNDQMVKIVAEIVTLTSAAAASNPALAPPQAPGGAQ